MIRSVPCPHENDNNPRHPDTVPANPFGRPSSAHRFLMPTRVVEVPGFRSAWFEGQEPNDQVERGVHGLGANRRPITHQLQPFGKDQWFERPPAPRDS